MHELALRYVEALPLPPAALVCLASMVPVIESRYAIMFACALGIPFAQALALTTAGNTLPMVPVLLLLGPISDRLRVWPVADRFFTWLFARARKRRDLIDRYGPLGLALFVAVPLPGSGGYSGAILAFVLGLRFWPSLIAIIAGILASAIACGAGAYGLASL
ncbi:MAG TPA: small multi-drug export protein [Armatimonadota bacterium]|nr:small multi-drug export protein [Armatimonadota bacterium]HQK95645.1 small multi-drug export protein [Armatimonadota bacterium]